MWNGMDLILTAVCPGKHFKHLQQCYEIYSIPEISK
jgi:hypothetical protein